MSPELDALTEQVQRLTRIVSGLQRRLGGSGEQTDGTWLCVGQCVHGPGHENECRCMTMSPKP